MPRARIEFQAEQRAARIRINAELRAGELLKGMQKATGGEHGGRKSKKNGRRA